MKIDLFLDATHEFPWHLHLIAGWRAEGHAVSVAIVPGRPWPAAIDLLLSLEALLYRNPRRAPPVMGACGTDRWERGADADFVLDLSTGPERAGALRLLYDGVPDPLAAVSALLDGRMPALALTRDGRVLEAALPANETPDVLGAGLDAVFARALDLCRKAPGARAAQDGAAGVQGKMQGALPGTLPSLGAAAGFATSALLGKVRRRLMRRLTQPDTWRIGYRRLDGPGIRDLGHVPDGFAWLPDDGRRYFADPFIHHHEGRNWVFCEEYPYATGKGVISAFEIGPDGQAGAPRVVLEAACHLSYPYVFAAAGEIWMMPESSADGDLALYRAVEFPGRWQRERTLLGGIAIGDATPVAADGRLWLFGSLTGAPGGSSWDALGLFHAPGLFGDFRPHPLNPVLIDAGAARPAGRIVRQDGALLRIAQDCRAGYGAGVTLARIDRLDPEGYAQTALAEIGPPPAWKARGLHTIDSNAGFEVIDCFSARVPGGAPGMA